jgi:hypothetical protein
MGCNSCSNITLPGVAGSQGADGTQGPQGPIGNPGPAGASVSVIEIDTSPVTGRTSDYQSTPNKRVSIPADTWENVDDMVELEVMFQTSGKYTPNSEPFMKIELGGVPVKIYCGNVNNEVAFKSDVGIRSGQNQIVKMKIQLPMTAAGSVMPILETSVYSGTSAGTEYFSLAYDTSSPVSSSYGRCDATTGLTLNSSIDLDVYMKDTYVGDNPQSFNMIYYKLLSYKKITT